MQPAHVEINVLKSFDFSKCHFKWFVSFSPLYKGEKTDIGKNGICTLQFYLCTFLFIPAYTRYNIGEIEKKLWKLIKLISI